MDPGKQKQVSVALAPEIRTQLEQVSEAAGLSVAEEIRRRIERTFAEDAIDPVTREAADAFVNLAATISADLGEWYRYIHANDAFVAAIVQRIAEYAVGYKKETPPSWDFFESFGADDPVETIGRMHERRDRGLGRYPYLEAAQQSYGKLRRHLRQK